MKIERIEINTLNVPFKHAIRVPIGILDAAQNVVIKITTEDGTYGWGEASPFAPITGDSQKSNLAMAQDLAKLILGKNALSVDVRMAEINRYTVGETSIKSAFDMALYDIAAKAAQMPLYQFLGGEKHEIRTDITIGMQTTIEDTLARVQEMLDAGFDAIKLKVGRPGLEDVKHVSAVRDLCGPDVHIKIDSNQGWDLPTAIANINAMHPLKLDYSEQPLPAWNYDGLANLRTQVPLPICADESVFDHRDALKLINQKAVDYLNIKLGKSGGIRNALKINSIAESAGMKCMIGCFAESRLGLSAAAHLAMARPNIHFLDLDCAYGFKSDPIKGGMAYDTEKGGVIHLPDVPGHGAEVDPEQLNPENTIEISKSSD